MRRSALDVKRKYFFNRGSVRNTTVIYRCKKLFLEAKHFHTRLNCTKPDVTKTFFVILFHLRGRHSENIRPRTFAAQKILAKGRGTGNQLVLYSLLIPPFKVPIFFSQLNPICFLFLFFVFFFVFVFFNDLT